MLESGSVLGLVLLFYGIRSIRRSKKERQLSFKLEKDSRIAEAYLRTILADELFETGVAYLVFGIGLLVVVAFVWRIMIESG